MIAVMIAFLTFGMLLITGVAFGQVPPVVLPSEPTMTDMFTAVVALFGSWKTLTYQYQISAVLFLVVGLVKNSAMQPAWDKLGKLKVLVGPVLSLVAFLFLVQPFTVQTALAAVTTGFAAGAAAQVLDVLKTVPKIGAFIHFISEIIGKILKKP